MDRTLISWNVPNMITVPLMAAVGFVALAVVWQTFAKWTADKKTPTNAASGY